MPGVSGEQHLLSGSFFVEHSPSPSAFSLEEIENPSSPQKSFSTSSDESELPGHSFKSGIEQMQTLNFFSGGTNSEKCSSKHGSDGSLRKSLAKSISFGSSGYGFSFIDDFSAMDAGNGVDGLFSESFPSGVSVAQKDDSASIPTPTNGAVVESPDALTALHKFLPSNNEDETSWAAVDAYSCDEFRMYEFKVRRCMRGRSHDWTECPFAHPGEKARRRDPRRFHYSGTGCPEFRKGNCRRGDACEFAHGVFECWLHPARYRTQPCKDGRNCRRRVCFFAHTPEQLRLLPGVSQSLNVASRSSFQASSLRSSLAGSYDGSPLRYASGPSFDGTFAYDGSNPVYYEGSSNSNGHGGSPRGHWGYLCKANPSQITSPTSTLVGHSRSPPSLSPPLSPSGSPPMSPDSPTSWSGSPNYSMSPRYQKPSIQGDINNLQAQLSPASFASLTSGYQNPVKVAVSLGLGSPAACHRRQVEKMGSFPSMMVSSLSSSSGLPQADCPSSPKVIGDLISSLQNMELGATPGWLQEQSGHLMGLQERSGHLMGVAYGSPRAASNLRHCSLSLPSTPTKSRWEAKTDGWESEAAGDGLQRVESGRDLRAKIYARLSKEANLHDISNNNNNGDSPDLGWVNELVM